MACGPFVGEALGATPTIVCDDDLTLMLTGECDAAGRVHPLEPV